VLKVTFCKLDPEDMFDRIPRGGTEEIQVEAVLGLNNTGQDEVSIRAPVRVRFKRPDVFDDADGYVYSNNMAGPGESQEKVLVGVCLKPKTGEAVTVDLLKAEGMTVEYKQEPLGEAETNWP